MRILIDIPDIKYQNIVNAYSDNNEIYAAIKNGTPIPDNATVCDIEQIRAKIQKVLDAERDFTSENAKAQAIALRWCLEIIDKYTKGEQEWYWKTLTL